MYRISLLSLHFACRQLLLHSVCIASRRPCLPGFPRKMKYCGFLRLDCSFRFFCHSRNIRLQLETVRKKRSVVIFIMLESFEDDTVAKKSTVSADNAKTAKKSIIVFNAGFFLLCNYFSLYPSSLFLNSLAMSRFTSLSFIAALLSNSFFPLQSPRFIFTSPFFR